MIRKIGILVGGGPAPGLNGVIAAVTLEAVRNGIDVVGFMDGYRWLAKGDMKALGENTRNLLPKDVSGIHFTGGSILRTSRTNAVKIKNGVENSVAALKSLGIDAMVTIGGDDTAFCASEIARSAGGKIKFAHVPKTIDNDLPLPPHVPTFGFETARHLGSTLVKNLIEDSRIMNRWYVVVAMGRNTGHLALGIAKSAGAALAIIPEEFQCTGFIPLQQVCDILETSIVKRRALGESFGILVIAEGIIERLDPEVLRQLPGVIVQYDPFGHLQLSEIELGKVVKNEIEKRFHQRDDNLRMVDINIGYVLRCADPIPFDQEYTRELGCNAVQYLLSNSPEHRPNAMIVVDSGKVCPIPLEKIIDPRTGKTAVRHVDIESESYRIARKYMIRLEKKDLEDAQLLSRMAKIVQMKDREFVERFGYLVTN